MARAIKANELPRTTEISKLLDAAAKEIEGYAEGRKEKNAETLAVTEAAREEINLLTYKKIGFFAQLYEAVEKSAHNRDIHEVLDELLKEHNEAVLSQGDKAVGRVVNFTEKLKDNPQAKLIRIVDAKVPEEKKLRAVDVSRWSKVLITAKERKWEAKDVAERVQNFTSESGERGMTAIVRLSEAKNALAAEVANKTAPEGYENFTEADLLKWNDERIKASRKNEVTVKLSAIQEQLKSNVFDVDGYFNSSGSGVKILAYYLEEGKVAGAVPLELTEEIQTEALKKALKTSKKISAPVVADKGQQQLAVTEFPGEYEYMWEAVRLCQAFNAKRDVVIELTPDSITVSNDYSTASPLKDIEQVFCYTRSKRTKGKDKRLDTFADNVKLLIKSGDTKHSASGRHFSVKKLDERRYEIESEKEPFAVTTTNLSITFQVANLRPTAVQLLPTLNVIASKVAEQEGKAKVDSSDKKKRVDAAFTEETRTYWHGKADKDWKEVIDSDWVADGNKITKSEGLDLGESAYIGCLAEPVKKIYKKANSMLVDEAKAHKWKNVSKFPFWDTFPQPYLYPVLASHKEKSIPNWNVADAIGVAKPYGETLFYAVALAATMGSESHLHSLQEKSLEEVKEFERVPDNEEDHAGIDEI